MVIGLIIYHYKNSMAGHNIIRAIYIAYVNYNPFLVEQFKLFALLFFHTI